MNVVNVEEFEKLRNERASLVVMFSAVWCAPCKMLYPTVDAIAEAVPDVTFVKFDVDSDSKTATRFGVRGVPTLLFFKDGTVVDQLVGAVPKSAITEALDKCF